MLKLAEIAAALEQVAPPALQESYDNSGLLVGEYNREVSRALLSLDCTEEVVEEAVRLQCDLIIAHHPIVFKGLKRLNGKNYVERTVMSAIRNNIALYACHTNLDNVLRQGVSTHIAEKLGLQNLQILDPKPEQLCKLVVFTPNSHAAQVRQSLYDAGAGEIGKYDACSFNLAGEGTFRAGEGANPFVGEKGVLHTEAEIRTEVVLPVIKLNQAVRAMKAVHPYEEVAWDAYPLLNTWDEVGSGIVGLLPEPLSPEVFLAWLKDRMELQVIRYTRSNLSQIQKVAVCGGAGSFLTGKALAAGADAYVTADVKYHEFFDAEGRLLLCDIGHYESEKYTTEIFARVLSQKFPTFATIFSTTLTNPIQYHT
ncbi:MAG: Nif3-like dinuclear metal center hexameric protein [Bacteroidetes bacterium]|nr:Nif3-like dinuclear metal center hexameric protein [Bacteroidota bacterium]